jgi:hypothetical protein
MIARLHYHVHMRLLVMGRSVEKLALWVKEKRSKTGVASD